MRTVKLEMSTSNLLRANRVLYNVPAYILDSMQRVIHSCHLRHTPLHMYLRYCTRCTRC